MGLAALCHRKKDRMHRVVLSWCTSTTSCIGHGSCQNVASSVNALSVQPSGVVTLRLCARPITASVDRRPVRLCARPIPASVGWRPVRLCATPIPASVGRRPVRLCARPIPASVGWRPVRLCAKPSPAPVGWRPVRLCATPIPASVGRAYSLRLVDSAKFDAWNRGCAGK